MKNLTKVFAIAIVMFGFATNSFAQNEVSATASASATIVTPISITKMIDLDFGSIAVQELTAGTVEMNPAGARTAGGGVTLPAIGTGGAVASFDVAGEPLYTYDITLPNTCTISGDGADMTISTFTCSIDLTAGTLNASGKETFTVGATLAVGANQTAGVYTKASAFDIIVNYN